MSTRQILWAVAGVCGAATIGLVVVAALADLDTGDRVASIVGAAAGLLGCALSVYFGLRQAGGTGVTVHAGGRGAVAAGGNATGNAVGKNSKVTRAVTPPGSPAQPAPTPPPGQQVAAHGSGAAAAGGNATGNALGKGSEVEER
ncbi:hypothetical protein ABZY03_00500 [Streptomyces klenkii]|uniref:hypothetical protein n=1 Tax=Streptomyces klenkii TaxID=1420899 RepID=UPI0033B05ADF